MRILYLQQLLVLPNTPGNGRSFEFARSWVFQGHEVHFLSSTAGIPPDYPKLEKGDLHARHYLTEGVQLHLIPVDYSHHMSFQRRIFSFLRFYRKAKRLAPKLGKFDLILAYSAPLSVGELGRVLAKKLHCPFVFEVADVWPDVPIGMGLLPFPSLARWLIQRTNRMYEEAAHIIAFSEGMKAQILSHGPWQDKITVIHNGSQLRASLASRHEASPEVHVLYSGTIGKANGLDQIIRVAQKIEAIGRVDIRFTILGDGNAASFVRQEAEKVSLSNLTFLPKVNKEAARDLMESADIGLVSFAPFPVLEANSATKFFDYLAQGLPVLINYEGWQAEYLRNWQCGLSSPMGDQAAFIQNLLYLADHPEIRQAMGKRGRELAAEKFDRKALAAKTLQILENALLS